MKESKLLFIDDNKFELESLKHFLPDYNIITYSDPELACKEAIKKDKFDIIILDIFIPGMNGLEIFKNIKVSRNKDAYIIAYTALSRRVILDTIHELGFDEIMVKPVNMDVLDIRIKSVLSKLNEKKSHNISFTENKGSFGFSLKGKDLGITYKEYQLLKLLLDKKGQIVTHDEIYNCLYGKAERTFDIIKTHLKNLRAKIARIDSKTKYIKSVPTKGYIIYA